MSYFQLISSGNCVFHVYMQMDQMHHPHKIKVPSLVTISLFQQNDYSTIDNHTDSLFPVSCSNFTDYQKHRHKFVPQVPLTLANIQTDKMTLHEEEYPIAGGLDKLFPTLIGGGMKYFEQRVDPAGELVKSDKPLRVGASMRYHFLLTILL